jgi:MFS transporter, MHS family, proline/betaine transporter
VDLHLIKKRSNILHIVKLVNYFMNLKEKNKIIGAFLGTIVEYYDYSLYAFSAAVIASKFFPKSEDMTTALMNVFAIYAIGYISKPMGSIIFSRIGDKYGRKTALNTTVLGIAIPTVIIGLLPDYSQIGTLSIVILSICRFAQSIFIAGEYDGAAIYVIEHLGVKNKYTASAITRSMGVVGLLIGIGATNLFGSKMLPDWAWRVPFLFSIPLALITIYYRRKLEETPDFEKSKKYDVQLRNLVKVISNQWKGILMVILYAGGFGVTYQVSVIFMKQYLPIVIPETKLFMSTFSTILVGSFGVSMILSGILADRFGNIIVIKITLLLAILSALLLGVAVENQIANLAFIGSFGVAIFVAPFNGLAHGTIINVFPINERYRCIGIGHTAGSMLMSGTANYICLLVMKNYKMNLFPLFYVAAFSLISYYIINKFDRINKKIESFS